MISSLWMDTENLFVPKNDKIEQIFYFLQKS